jgi:hypothetical protein|tara:strand:- start:116 stop:535 length:420 start_codon:yes stop_codon:yes gene_type:complete
MSKEKIKDGYNQLNTPVVTHMCNLMQWVYSDPQIRGKFDKLIVKGEERKVAPFLSALQAFILTTAVSMREPGQEKIRVKSGDELKLAMDKVIMLLETYLEQPLRSNLINGLDLYVSNSKFETKPISDEHANALFEKKPN